MLECLFNKVEGLRPTSLLKRDSITSVSSVNFARFFRTPILYNIRERLLLVLVRIGFDWQFNRYFTSFKLIDILHHLLQVKSVFNVLECNFQLILHWWAPNQRSNIYNAMQVIMEVYLDIQTAARGNTGIKSVWLTSLKRCIRACCL